MVSLAVIAACGRIGFDPLEASARQTYLKAPNTDAGDLFGFSIALSADGTTMAVGAYQEQSAATGIGGDQADDSADLAGAVYVYRRPIESEAWNLEAYVKASNTQAFDWFGQDVSLSADGNTLAVGAQLEDSLASGVGGDQTNEAGLNAGAAYVFVRQGSVWTQQAYIKASNPSLSDEFGAALALSGDGDTLAVGGFREDSAARGIDGNQADESADGAGAVYVFRRTGGVWAQEAYVKASNTGPADLFGSRVSMSFDGAVLAVGAELEDSAATGIGGNQDDESAMDAGAAYVFRRSGVTWAQTAYIKAPITDAGDRFGADVELSDDATRLVVSAGSEDSAAFGVDGDPTDNGADRAGAVWLLRDDGNGWVYEAYLKASNTGPGDFFGANLALSGDGSRLVVGATLEDSAAIGLDGIQADDGAVDSGAFYVFDRDGTTWRQVLYGKASNTSAGDNLGVGVALSADGLTGALGARYEDSAATGIGGLQTDESAQDAGAVYILR